MTTHFRRNVILLSVTAILGVILAGSVGPCGEPSGLASIVFTPPQDLGIDTAISQIDCCTEAGEIAILAIGNDGIRAVDWSLSFSPRGLGVTASTMSGRLHPGQRADVSLSIATCPEPGDVQRIEVSVSLDTPFNSSLNVTNAYEVLIVRRCDARERLVIFVNQLTGLEGLSALASAQSIFGSTSERLAVAATGTYGLIDVAGGTTEVLSAGGASHFGAVPLRSPTNAQSDVLVAFGALGVEVRLFVDEDGAFSPFAQNDPPNSAPVFDVVTYAADPNAVGVVVARQDRVESREFSSDTSVDGLGEGSIAISANALIAAGAVGDIVSAFALSSTGPVLVATEGDPGTSNGQLFFWTADDPEKLTLIGSTGDTPRRIRGVKIGETWLLAVSNFGDSSLTLIRRDGSSAPTITGSVALSGQPVGIDAKATSDGAAAFVATGFDTDTFSIVKVATDGSVVSNTPTALDPSEVEAPAHAVWLDDGAVAISGNASNTVLIVPDVLP